MEARLKGIAVYLHGIRNDSTQKKPATPLSRELSPNQSSPSPSKTDRILKRSVSPTFAGLERPSLRRRAASPTAQNLPLRKDPGESSLSGLGGFYGLSGITLPNTRTELISQYQKPLWELPFQGLKPGASVKRKQVADYQKDAATLMSRSLRKHFLKVFAVLKGLVPAQIPLGRGHSESRLRVIVSDRMGTSRSPGLESKNPSFPRVCKRAEKSENVSIIKSPTHHSGWSNGNLTEPLASPQAAEDPVDITYLEPDRTRPIRLKIEGFERVKTIQSPKIGQETVKSQKENLSGFLSYGNVGFHAEEANPGLEPENTGAGDLKLPLVLLRLVQNRVGNAFNLIWTSMRQASGSRRIFAFIQRRALLRYQDFLYALAFSSPKPSRTRLSRPASRQSQESPVFNQRVYRIDSASKITRKCLENGARTLVSALTSHQSHSFSRIREFALWRESALQNKRKCARNLGVILVLILNKRYQVTMNILKRLKKAKNKLLAEAKYRLRACFRIFTVRRLKLLTRFFGRLRGNRNQIRTWKKAEVRINPGRQVQDAKERVLTGNLSLERVKTDAFLEKETKSQLKGNELKLAGNAHFKVGKISLGSDTFPLGKSDGKPVAFDKYGLVKIKGMFANVAKNVRFRVESAMKIWRNIRKKSSMDSFEADLVGKICDKLIKSRLFLSFSALKFTHRSNSRSKSAFAIPIVRFVQRKLESLQMYSFQKIKRGTFFQASSPGDFASSRILTNLVSVLSAKAALSFDAIQDFARYRVYIKKARIVALRGVGNIVTKRCNTGKEAAFTQLKRALALTFPSDFHGFPHDFNQTKPGQNRILIQRNLTHDFLVQDDLRMKNRSVFPYQQPSFSTVLSTSESDQSLAVLSLLHSDTSNTKKVGFQDRKDHVSDESRMVAYTVQHLYCLYECLSVRVQLSQAFAFHRLANSY